MCLDKGLQSIAVTGRLPKDTVLGADDRLATEYICVFLSVASLDRVHDDEGPYVVVEGHKVDVTVGWTRNGSTRTGRELGR